MYALNLVIQTIIIIVFDWDLIVFVIRSLYLLHLDKLMEIKAYVLQTSFA